MAVQGIGRDARRRWQVLAVAALLAGCAAERPAAGAGDDNPGGPEPSPVDTVLDKLRQGYLTVAYERAVVAAEAHPQSVEAQWLASFLDLLLLGNEFGIVGTATQPPMIQAATERFGQSLNGDVDFAAAQRELVAVAERLRRIAGRVQGVEPGPGFALEVSRFTLEVPNLAAIRELSQGSIDLDFYGELDMAGRWDVGFFRLYRSLVSSADAAATILLAHRLDGDWQGLSRYLREIAGEADGLAAAEYSDELLVWLLNDPRSAGFLALGPGGAGRFDEAAEALATFGRDFLAAMEDLRTTDPNPEERVIALFDKVDDGRPTYGVGKVDSDQLLLPPFRAITDAASERTAMPIRAAYERTAKALVADLDGDAGGPGLRVVGDVLSAGIQLALFALEVVYGEAGDDSFYGYINNEELVEESLAGILGDPAVMRPSRWLRGSRAAIRDLLPAWEREASWRPASFLFEADCRYVYDPDDAEAYRRRDAGAFCDDGRSHTYADPDRGHFAGLTDPVAGALAIPPDGVSGPLVYVPWRDASFGGMLELELGGLSEVAAPGALAGEDLSLRPATSYSLNKAVAIVGRQLEPFVESSPYVTP